MVGTGDLRFKVGLLLTCFDLTQVEIEVTGNTLISL
jgi:hypothetical protein